MLVDGATAVAVLSEDANLASAISLLLADGVTAVVVLPEDSNLASAISLLLADGVTIRSGVSNVTAAVRSDGAKVLPSVEDMEGGITRASDGGKVVVAVYINVRISIQDVITNIPEVVPMHSQHCHPELLLNWKQLTQEWQPGLEQD